jgi:cysteinyl-tRNA synthetase
MVELHIYNTLTRKKEKFIPITPDRVGIYVCGPTVYGHSHLGHAKSYISFDIIVRYFRHLGYKVRYVQNITDVGHLLGDFQDGEDRIERQARLENLEPMEVVEAYTRSYFEDMDNLGLVRPDISPRASGHIIEQIEMIKQLIEKGFAYEMRGNVYFDVHKFPSYGNLSGRKIDELEAGARVDIVEEKKHPADFALWKKAGKEHLMRWPSPWSSGYPGWHIECSCMSTKYLGETFDIHGGGLENVFPHHECEIAQSEGAYGKPFARYWIHNNMVTIDGVKMSKSLNNFVSIKDALKRYNPIAVRYFILMSHYRSVLDFSEEALAAAQKGLKKIQTSYERIAYAIKNAENFDSNDMLALSQFESNFHKAMNDDFNTPQAIAAVFEMLTEVNKRLDDPGNRPSKDQLIKVKSTLQSTAGAVLGILSQEAAAISNIEDKFNKVMQLILNLRAKLRKDKNYQMSDKIRDDLSEIGISVKDSADSATWHIE